MASRLRLSSPIPSIQLHPTVARSALPWPPTFGDIDLSTGLPSAVDYSTGNDEKLDLSATGAVALPFDEYMSGFGGFHNGLWGLAKDIGNKVGHNLNIRLFREKYAGTHWVFKKQ